MRIAIVHLSDIHFNADPGRDSLLGRQDALAACIANDCKDVDACVFALSGDLAFSGRPEQFALAATLIETLRSRLTVAHPKCQQEVVIVPGNHDCDFRNEKQIRQTVINSLSTENLSDGSVATTLCEVQQAFFEFARNITGRKNLFENPLFHVDDFELMGEQIRFLSLNTAWCSQLHEEQGSMQYPSSCIAECDQTPKSTAVTVALLHHPTRWLEANNSRAVRQGIESRADIILTGHEHVAEVYRKTGPRGEQNDFIEGAVLQDSESDRSAFNLVIVDTTKQLQQTKQFTFDEDAYRHTDDAVVERPFERSQRHVQAAFPIAPDFFENVLEDPGVAFTHPRKNPIQLSDLYVYPDCRRLRKQVDDLAAGIVHSRDLLSFVRDKDGVVAYGDEQCGKTALMRTLFRDMHANGLVPVFLNGDDLKYSTAPDILNRVEERLGEQYGCKEAAEYWALNHASRAILIDDLHKSPLGRDGLSQCLTILTEKFGTLVATASEEFQTLISAGSESKNIAIHQLQPIAILELGATRRSQLIHSWHRLGRASGFDESAIEAEIIHLESVIESLLLRDLLPAHPIFVLILLQGYESSAGIRTETGSFGFLYEQIIAASLSEATGIGAQIGSLYTYLSSFAAELYYQQRASLSRDDCSDWHSRHCDELDIDLSFDRVFGSLLAARILWHEHGLYRFKYPFVYYYFFAHHLSRNLNHISVQSEIAKLAKVTHQESAANIIMFLCHLTHDDYVIDTLLEASAKLFAEYEPCELGDDVAFLEEAVSPGLTLPSTSTAENRQEMRRAADEEQQRRPEVKRPAPEPPDFADHTDTAAFAAKINAAGKHIQILGQVLRSFHGSLPKERKAQILEATYSLGLRMLASAFIAFKKNETGIVEAYEEWLRLKHPEWSKERIERTARIQFIRVLDWLTLGLVKHVSNSVGLPHLRKTFKRVAEAEDSTNAIRLIDVSIKLDHFRSFPIAEVDTLIKRTDSVTFPRSLLRHLVWFHYYMYPTRDVATKQSVCDRLGIQMKGKLIAGSHKKARR